MLKNVDSTQKSKGHFRKKGSQGTRLKRFSDQDTHHNWVEFLVFIYIYIYIISPIQVGIGITLLSLSNHFSQLTFSPIVNGPTADLILLYNSYGPVPAHFPSQVFASSFDVSLLCNIVLHEPALGSGLQFLPVYLHSQV